MASEAGIRPDHPARTPNERSRVDETPTLDGSKTALHETDPAVRLLIGRYTADLLDHNGHVCAVIGAGAGSSPELAYVDVATVALLITIAVRAERVTVWQSQGWPLAC